MKLSDRQFSILVVDDEADIRCASERILTRMGHRVFLAAHGREGLEKLAGSGVDIVFLDLKMPGPDGLEILSRLRGAYPHILVIIITGYATLETAIEAMKKGAYDFITKPFQPDQLRLVAARAVDHLKLREDRDRLSAEKEQGLWSIATENSRLRTVVDSIAAGILITDRDRRIVMTNPAFHRMLKVHRDGLIGTGLSAHPDLCELNEMADETLTPDACRESGCLREIVVRDEKPRHLVTTVNTVTTENGLVLGLVAVLRDVTHFREQEREKEAFIAMLTHELRSPLSSVDTQLHVILKGLAGDLTPKQSELFGRVRKRVRHVLSMITDLLDLSRIEARRFIQDIHPLDLNPVLMGSIEMLQDQAREKKQTVELGLQDGLPQIQADPTGLKNVAANLIQNAIRYTPEGGNLEIRSGHNESTVYFSVTDTGPGIAEEYREKIFERFFRIKDERTARITGSGLGLPIVKSIVETFGGAVTVDSGLQGGSVFTVRLPISGRGL